jgi:hypothetical protein
MSQAQEKPGTAMVFYPTFARLPRSHYHFQFEISSTAEQGIRARYFMSLERY